MRLALERFCHGTVEIPGLGSQDQHQFASLLDETVGIAATLVERWSAMLVSHLENAPGPTTTPANRSTVLVSLPSNTITCLDSAIDVLLGGDILWLRPSTREPVSPARFVAALEMSGWPASEIGLYPTSRSGLDTLVDVTDQQILFGGVELCEAFSGRPGVTVRGPETRTLYKPKASASAANLAHIVRGVVEHSGRFCTSVGRVIFDVDDIGFPAEFGAALDAIPIDDHASPYPIARWPDAAGARAIADDIESRLRPGDWVITKRPMVCDVQGRAVLVPTAVAVSDLDDHPLTARDYPFPFAVVSPAVGEEATRALGSAERVGT